MHFLRRSRGGNDPRDDALPPLTPRRTVAIDDRGVLYVDPVCPYCGAGFDPLPKGARKCPACGERVVYDRGFDDLVTLVREGEGSSDQDYEREQAARGSLFDRKDGRPLREMNEERLRTYDSLGIRVRIVNADSNTVVIGGTDRIGPGASSCDTCRGLVGLVYEARSAPVLPMANCRSRPNGICVCRYERVPPG